MFRQKTTESAVEPLTEITEPNEDLFVPEPQPVVEIEDYIAPQLVTYKVILDTINQDGDVYYRGGAILYYIGIEPYNYYAFFIRYLVALWA
ncbi:MAG: hypothetical protein ACQEP4_02490 [Bacillota bacterium]